MSGRIPESILTRPKRGFPLPLRAWLRGPLHAACRDQLLATGSMARTWLGRAHVTRLLDEHRSGEADRTEPLYALWVLENWYSAWLTSGFVSRSTRNVVRVATPIHPGVDGGLGLRT
jgi:asparagine synthase (glutamine-hydrolysing)